MGWNPKLPAFSLHLRTLHCEREGSQQVDGAETGVCVDIDSVFSGPQALGDSLVSVVLPPVLSTTPRSIHT